MTTRSTRHAAASGPSPQASPPGGAGAPVLRIEDLSVVFATESGPLHALDRVNLAVAPGRTLALVGESGSGKTVTGLAAMGLLPADRCTVAGAVFLGGTPLLPAPAEVVRARRGAEIAMVFQEPMSALNPVLRIGEQIAEPLVYHRGLGWSAARREAGRLLERVQIPDARVALDRYPHELSGGQRQRAMIAMAIACGPRMLIADEPTTALDVIIQAQVLRLLARLQREDGMALVLITHDFGVVAETADDVAVMYAGRIVESGPVRDVVARPIHPYTEGLVRATRLPPRDARMRLEEIPGTVPALRGIDPGCSFRDRCRLAIAECTNHRPRLAAAAAQHHVACVVRGAAA